MCIARAACSVREVAVNLPIYSSTKRISTFSKQSRYLPDPAAHLILIRYTVLSIRALSVSYHEY